MPSVTLILSKYASVYTNRKQRRSIYRIYLTIDKTSIMLKAILFLTFSLAVLSLTQAQVIENSPSINEAHTGLISNNNTIRIKQKSRVVTYEDARNSYNDIGGSPYLHEKHQPLVELYMTTGEVVEDVKIQYDCFHNEIIANKGDQVDVILETAFFESIVSPTNDMKYPLKRPNRDNPNKFYEILYEDDEVTFFKNTKVSMINHTVNVPGQQGSKEMFHRAETYYVVRGNRSPVQVKLKKDNFFILLPKEKRAELKIAMEELGLKKLKREEDYVSALNHFKNKSN